MGRADESEKKPVWSVLSDAGLINIPAEEFPERIKQAKNAVMEHLDELLDAPTDTQERASAAYSLATLTKVETTLKQSRKPRGSD